MRTPLLQTLYLFQKKKAKPNNTKSRQESLTLNSKKSNQSKQEVTSQVQLPVFVSKETREFYAMLAEQKRKEMVAN